LTAFREQFDGFGELVTALAQLLERRDVTECGLQGRLGEPLRQGPQLAGAGNVGRRIRRLLGFEVHEHRIHHQAPDEQADQDGELSADGEPG
jgi:hypothetical protein